MKNFILTIALTLFSLNSFAGVHLKCEQSIIDQSGYNDVMNGVKSIAILHCQNKNREQYTIFMKGYGLGYKFSMLSEYLVTCPTVSKRRINKKGKVVLGSARASASIVFGLNATVAANHRGGVCLVAGYEAMGFLASASVGKMVIYKGSVHHESVKKELIKYLPAHMID